MIVITVTNKQLNQIKSADSVLSFIFLVTLGKIDAYIVGRLFISYGCLLVPYVIDGDCLEKQKCNSVLTCSVAQWTETKSSDYFFQI